MGESTLIIIAIIGVIIYFLPTIVAGHHKSSNSIFALNLLAGWTFIGWVIALVWALNKKDKKQKKKNISVSDELLKLHDLKSKGIINESEFEELKAKLIK